MFAFNYSGNAFDDIESVPLREVAEFLRHNWTAHMTGNRLSYFRDMCQAWENKYGHSPTIREVVDCCLLVPYVVR